MKFISTFILLVMSASGLASQAIQFIDQTGKFAIPGSTDSIVVRKAKSMIQFRIREFGPNEPIISISSDWFIAVVDKDRYWVHLGNGRLFYYSWESDSKSRVEEWTYPNLGAIPLPKEVEDRIKNTAEQGAAANP